VIVVPASVVARQAKNIALAIDASEQKIPFEIIKTFIEELKAELKIIHVQTEHVDDREKLDRLKTEFNTSFHTIRDHEFIHGIQTYVQANKTDLLIIIPHKHSLIERMIFRTHTAELVHKLSIPIMCISED
jgi:hypothetical protein